MDVLFWERRDFYVSFPGMENRERLKTPSGSSMVDIDISSNIMKPPL